MLRALPAAVLAGALLWIAPAMGVGVVEAQTGPSTPPLVADANGLLPGDVIRVKIWREEDLSGEFQVDDKGSVVLPLLGSKNVLGISPDRLREQLTKDYDEFLRNTAVDVTLLRRIVVLGEVRVPGQYTVDATNSVADVIARAQGITPDGDANHIVLVRESQRLRTGLTGVESIQEAGIRSGDQIIVGKRSWASRNFSSMLSIISIVANVLDLVIK